MNVNVPMYMYTCMCVCTFMHVHMYTNRYKSMHIYSHVRVGACVYTYIICMNTPGAGSKNAPIFCKRAYKYSRVTYRIESCPVMQHVDARQIILVNTSSPDAHLLWARLYICSDHAQKWVMSCYLIYMMSVKSYLWRIHLLTSIFCRRAYKYSMIRQKNESFDIHRWVSSHTCEWFISWRPPSVGAPIIIQWSNIKISHVLSFHTHGWVSSHTYEWLIAWHPSFVGAPIHIHCHI